MTELGSTLDNGQQHLKVFNCQLESEQVSLKSTKTDQCKAANVFIPFRQYLSQKEYAS